MDTSKRNIPRIAIIGGDSAGWMTGLHRFIKETAIGMPTHDKYIRRNCRAPMS